MSNDNKKGLGSRGEKSSSDLGSGKNHLLIIGINKYTNDIPQLYNAVNDAVAFKKLMLNKYQFEEDNVKMLLNEDATHEGIYDVFEYYLGLLTEQDNLIFYFSGHGEYYQPYKTGYWIPVDAKKGKRNTYIPNDEIIKFLRESKARHVFGIVDSCFSAALFVPDRDLSAAERRHYYTPSRWLLTAGRLEPVSDGQFGDHSPFAKALLKILETNHEDHYWVSELCPKVLRGVEFNAENQLPRGEPLQNAGHYGGEFVFIRKGGVVPAARENSDEIDQLSPRRINAETETRHLAETTILTNNAEVLPQSLPQLKSYLKNLAAKNLEKALDDINGRLRDNSYMVNDFILLSAQFNQLKGDKARGIIPYNDSVVRQNQIIDSFQSLVDDLEDEDIRW